MDVNTGFLESSDGLYVELKKQRDWGWGDKFGSIGEPRRKKGS